MDVGQILYDFFARRIAERGIYSPIEYAVYGAIMLALAFFVIYPLLDRKGIRFNARFMLSLLPYILLGSALRVLEDTGILPRSWNPLEPAYYFVTPGIYLLIAAVTVFCLFVSLSLSKRFGWDSIKIFAAVGLILALPLAAFEVLLFQEWLGFSAAIAMAAAVVGALVFVFRKLNLVLLRGGFNIMVVASQALDGSATFVATQFFRCGEQHPLSGFFLELFPLSFVFMKIALVLVIIYYIDREIRRENLAGFAKTVVAILGFATGLRDLLTLGIGTCL